MAYVVKEIFLTLQGEGAQAGRRAVFVRFAGCNLWSGREEDRATAVCRFCDTDFLGTDGPGGGRYDTPFMLVHGILEAWGGAGARPFVVFTGGEPLLQLDDALIQTVRAQGIEIAVESNGTLVAPAGIDWLTISPKVGSELVQRQGQELKLVWPQDVDPSTYLGLDFTCWRLQPKDDQDYAQNLAATVTYCLEHPPWQLSLQQHKICGLP